MVLTFDILRMNFIPLITSTKGIKEYIRESIKQFPLERLSFTNIHPNKTQIKHFLHKIQVIALATAISFATGIPHTAEAEKEADSPSAAMTFQTQCLDVKDIAAAEVEALPEIPDKEPKRVMNVEATAYTSTVAQTDSSPFVTASGKRVHEGTLAANFLPFGTRVRLPDHFGDREFVVEDRLASRFHNRVDVWFPEYGQAIQFGYKRSIRIEVLD